MIWMTTFMAWGQTHLALAKPAGGETWGFVDKTGAFVIEAQYKKVEAFGPDGLAAVQIDKVWKFMDAKGAILETEPKKFALKSAAGFGIVGFDEGVAPVAVSKKWGYLGKDGKFVIQPKYNWVSRFEDGHATAKLGADYFILDKKGTENRVKAGNMMEIRRIDDGMAPFKTMAKTFGFVDTQGEVVIEPEFKAVGYFSEGVAWAKTMENTVGFIDKTGAWKIKPIYTGAKDFSGGVARVKHGDKWAFVKVDGTEISPSGVDTFKDIFEGMAKAKRDMKWGFIDATGAWVLEPQFENVRRFKNGLAAAKKGGLWGFIDKKGSWVVDPTYQTVRDMNIAE